MHSLDPKAARFKIAPHGILQERVGDGKVGTKHMLPEKQSMDTTLGVVGAVELALGMRA
jgi:hypothetical protein